MFLCGNVCNGDNQPEPDIIVRPMALHQKIKAIAQGKGNKPSKNSSVMLRKSKFNEYLQECKKMDIKFTDPDFLPNEKNLDFKVEGRSLAWKRASEIIKDCVMVQEQFSPSDICQGNIGDCYFLSSIAALAQLQERISAIFYENFDVSPQGIYKLIVNNQGIPSQMIIDDFVPVFAQTNRPVFCKSTKKQIWVMLIQKAWAKIKGSYGAISAGCPHEVLNTFAVAPCYFYQIQEDQDQEYKDLVWTQLMEAADEQMPVVAGTRSEVKVPGLLPSHAYTILDCETIPSYGKDCRLMRLRNPWGKTQYSGFGSETDKTFWDGVPQNYIDQFRPAVGVDDGDFTMPFEEFMACFESVDISNCRWGFSYEFQRIKMTKGEPAFIRLNVKQEHQGFITLKRQFSEGKNQEVVTTNYGHARVIVALQRQEDTYEYYSSVFQNDFPDLNLWLQYKPGSYLIMIQTEDPRLLNQFQCTFGYYFDSLQEISNKQIIVESNKKYPNFLQQVWTNHAIRLNDEKSKIGPKPQDWIKTSFSYYQGGYGYVLCNLQKDTNIRISVTINKHQIKQSGFYLLGHYPEEVVLTAGYSKIFIFSYIFQGRKADDIAFPPPGFKIARIS